MRRRVSYKYARHLETIARIYLEEGQVKAKAAERVRTELGLRSFKPERFTVWADAPEWKAALEQARQERALATEFSPRVRGRKFLGWVRVVLPELQKAHEAAREGGDGKAARDLEARIVKLEEAARNEEKHLADQERQEALRDAASLARALLAELAEVGLPEPARLRLREIARDPSRLLERMKR